MLIILYFLNKNYALFFRPLKYNVISGRCCYWTIPPVKPITIEKIYRGTTEIKVPHCCLRVPSICMYLFVNNAPTYNVIF